MEEKFLRDSIKDENVKVPDSLLPENIGKLLEKQPQPAKRVKKGVIYRIAAAAAALIVLVGVSGIGIIVNSDKKNNSADMTMPGQTYEDIYTRMHGGFFDNLFRYLSGDGIYWEESITDSMATNSGSAAGTSTDMAVMQPEDTVLNDVEVEYSATAEDEEPEEFSTTNLQELGVDEGDIYKTDGKYIYILKSSTDNSGGSLMILSADDGSISKVSETDIEVPGEYCWMSLEDMYVDGDRLAVVGTTRKTEYEENNDYILTYARIYDISDRAVPKQLDIVKQSGSYITSRKSGGVLYLFSDFTCFTDIRKKNYNSYVPRCGNELVDAGNVYCPDEIEYEGYTVIGSVDFVNPDGYIDSEAVMVNSEDMYVSSNAIYFITRGTEMGGERVEGSRTYAYYMSNLIKYDYDNGMLSYVNTAEIPGSADNQFAFSEHEGNLRVVVTSSRYVKYSNEDGYMYDTTCAGLYIYDENLNLSGCIEDLADGEMVKSSRFIGDMAYFVTFRQTDPLFAVDVSDPSNPVILSELKLPGFSEYMHPYGEGKMLGIGYEADVNTGITSCIKLSMFDISDGGDVTEESRLLLDNSFYSGVLYNHKLLLINPEKNIFGFASTYEQSGEGGYWNGNYELYQLFTYDEERGFTELLACRLEEYDSYSYYDRYYSDTEGYVLDYARALYIGDYLYILDYDYGIEIYNMTDYSYVGKWTEE